MNMLNNNVRKESTGPHRWIPRLWSVNHRQLQRSLARRFDCGNHCFSEIGLMDSAPEPRRVIQGHPGETVTVQFAAGKVAVFEVQVDRKGIA